jgi:hypothetical protein
LDCRHVCITCAFHDALRAYLFSIIHRTPLIWRLRTSFCFPAWRASLYNWWLQDKKHAKIF